MEWRKQVRELTQGLNQKHVNQQQVQGIKPLNTPVITPKTSSAPTTKTIKPASNLYRYSLLVFALLFSIATHANLDTDGDGLIGDADPFPNDASNKASANWSFCSGEFGICTPPVPALVRYGVEDQYFFQQVTSSIDCKNSAFGNPVNVRKQCDYLLSDTADSDNDGVVDNLDVFPADPSESLDSDGDGFGDNADPFPNDATNKANAAWLFCSGEFGICTPPTPALVRYGLDGQYYYQQVNTSIDCKNSAFGNPVNERKQCDYLLSDTVDTDGDGVVDSHDAFPNDPLESHDSDGDGFGDNADPFPNDATNKANAAWLFCSGEFGICTPPAPALVRYGLNGQYFYQQVISSIDCKNSAFGDPINLRKQCDYLLSETADYDNDGVVDNLDAFPNDSSETLDSDGDGLGDNADYFPNDATNALNANWISCGGEGYTCNPPVPALARYGVAELNEYVMQTVDDSILCRNATFGFRTGGIYTRSCDYLLSDTSDHDNDGVADRVDAFPADPLENQDTDGDGFGDNSDLFPNDANNSPSGTWVRCSEEFGICRLPITTAVRYGIEGQYFYKRTSGNIECKNHVFGNPADARKHCDYFLSDAEDTDGDGVIDNVDAFPGDINESHDSDEDGIGDNADPYPSDPNNGIGDNSDLDPLDPINEIDEGGVDWVHCADEWEVCNVPVPATVRYGANGVYVFKWVTEATDCTNTIFSDPIGNVAKQCAYLISEKKDFDNDGVVDSLDLFPADPSEAQDSDGDGIGNSADTDDDNDNVLDINDPFPTDPNNDIASANWYRCADEGDTCNLSSPSIVRYGVSGSYVYQHANDSFTCNASIFGESTVDDSRHCDYLLSHQVDTDNDGLADSVDPYPNDPQNNPSQGWLRCAAQGEPCQVPEESIVRYGAEDQYHFRIVADSVTCNSISFSGDPILRVEKYCDYRPVNVAPVINGKQGGWLEVGAGSYSVKSTVSTSLGIDNNNLSYVAYADSNNEDKATVKRFTGAIWEVVGIEGFSEGKAFDLSIVIDNNNVPYVSYEDGGDSYNRVIKKFNGTAWETVALDGLSPYQAGYFSINLDNSNVPYIVYADRDNDSKVIVKKLTGTGWEVVGTEALSLGRSSNISMNIDSNNVLYLAYYDLGKSTANRLVVKRFDGISWETLAEYNAITFAVSIDNNNVPYVIYADRGDSNKVTAKRFNGSDWELVENEGLPLSSVNYLDMNIAGNDVPYISYTSYENEKSFVKRFNGTNWEAIGEVGAPWESIRPITIRIDNNNVPYMLYMERDFTERVYVKRFYENTMVHRVVDHQATAIDINATDNFDRVLYYSLANSYDASLFTINEYSGLVTFNNAPDVENPHDSDNDNIYVFEVKVENTQGLSTVQKVNIVVIKNNQLWLTESPTTTALDQVTIEVNGQPGSQISVNGINTGAILSGNGVGTAGINLDTSGEDGYKVFSLTLIDPLGNESESVDITVLKDTAVPNAPVVKGVPRVASSDLTYVYVSGEIGTKVFVNGVDSRDTIGPVGETTLILDTSGAYGPKEFAITLQDRVGNASEVYSFVIYRDSGSSPVISNVKTQGWLDLGAGNASIGEGLYPSMVFDNNDVPYIVYVDRGIGVNFGRVSVKRFSRASADWESMGLSTNPVDHASIDIDNNNVPYVAYNDKWNLSKAVVKRYNGTSWDAVGVDGFTEGVADNILIRIDDNNVPYVAYTDGVNSSKVTVKKFNGTAWEAVGNEGFSEGFSSNFSLSFDDNDMPYIVYSDSQSGSSFSSKTIAKRFNGTTWEPVGGQAVVGEDTVFPDMNMDSNGVPYVTYIDSDNGSTVSVKRFNGTTWEISSEGIPDSAADSSAIGLGDNNTPYLAYEVVWSDSRATEDNVFVARFDGSAWKAVGKELAPPDNWDWWEYEYNYWEFEWEQGSSETQYGINLDVKVGKNNTPYIIYTQGGNETNNISVKRYYDGSILQSVLDRQTTAIDIDASVSNNSALQYSLMDGYDAALFTIDGNSGVITFITEPDIENPHDSNQDNVYTFEVMVVSEQGGITIQKVNIFIVRNDTPRLTTTPTETTEDSVTVEVNGNVEGERVFVNGSDTNVTLLADKKATITLDTSGEDGHKHFDINLKQDGVDYFSNTLSFSILKDVTVPQLVSGWPANSEVIGLSHTNQLELAYTFVDHNGIDSITIYDHEGTDISDSATINSNSIVLVLTPEQDTSYSYTITVEDILGNTNDFAVSFDVKSYAPVTIASRPSGFYGEPINVDLIAAEGDTIYYSTDGYPPIIGAANTTKGIGRIKDISISATTNLQYFAIDTAGNKEKTKSSIYRINDLDNYSNTITADYDVSSHQVTLSWHADLDAKEYKVYRVASKLDLQVLNKSREQEYLAPDTYVIGVSPSSSFTDSSVANGANYYYAISKVNQSGFESLISEPVQATIAPEDPATDRNDAITRAKYWLYSMQNTDGSWGSIPNIKLLTTTSALDALHDYQHENKYIINKSLGYVLGQYADNNDYLSRQITTLSAYDLYTADKRSKLLSGASYVTRNYTTYQPTYFYGGNTTQGQARLEELTANGIEYKTFVDAHGNTVWAWMSPIPRQSRREGISAWSLSQSYEITAFDTALAYKAIFGSITSVNSNANSIIETFKTNKLIRNDEGRWSWVNKGEASIYVSAFIYGIMESAPHIDLTPSVFAQERPKGPQAKPDDYAWITQAQNSDGSFGKGLLDTLGVVLYLQLSAEQKNLALEYIISQQSAMGDFFNDIYLSALALQALSKGVE